MSSSLGAIEPLRVGTIDYPPYIYAADQNLQGISIDLLSTLLTETNIKAEINIYPWKRALRLVEAGELDAVFPALKTLERERYLQFMDDVFYEEHVSAFYLNGNAYTYDAGLHFLKGSRVCLQRGFSVGEKMDQFFSAGHAIKVQVSEQTDCVRLMEKNAIEFYISDRLSGELAIKKMNLHHRILPLSEAIQRTPTYIAFSRHHPRTQLFKAMNEKLRTLQKTGAWREVIAQTEKKYVEKISMKMRLD